MKKLIIALLMFALVIPIVLGASVCRQAELGYSWCQGLYGDDEENLTMDRGNFTSLTLGIGGLTMWGNINMNSYSIFNAHWVNTTYTNVTINYTQLSDEHWLNETREVGDFELDGNLDVCGDVVIKNNSAYWNLSFRKIGTSVFPMLDMMADSDLGLINLGLMRSGFYMIPGLVLDYSTIEFCDSQGANCIYFRYYNGTKDTVVFDTLAARHPTLKLMGQLNVSENINASNVTAKQFIGDGSLLTGVPSKWNATTVLTPANSTLPVKINNNLTATNLSIVDSNGLIVATIDSNGLADWGYHSYIHRKGIPGEYIGWYFGSSVPSLVTTAATVGFNINMVIGQSASSKDLGMGWTNRVAGVFWIRDGLIAGDPYSLRHETYSKSQFDLFNDTNTRNNAEINIGFDALDTINLKGTVNAKHDLNVTGNITGENVFLPQYIFSHTNQTIPVLGANLWTNITFSQEDTDVKRGITHTYNDITNHTFTVMKDGIYNIDYDFDVEDTSAGASDIDVAGRLTFTNGTEVIGSVFEIDITRQGAEEELSHNFLVSCSAGEQFVFQFVASDADVQISTHGTFGDYPESASVLMNKIANLP